MSFIRCSNCRKLWRPHVNPLTDEPSWMPPAKAAKACKHDTAIEVWTGKAWDVRALVAS